MFSWSTANHRLYHQFSFRYKQILKENCDNCFKQLQYFLGVTKIVSDWSKTLETYIALPWLIVIQATLALCIHRLYHIWRWWNTIAAAFALLAFWTYWTQGEKATIWIRLFVEFRYFWCFLGHLNTYLVVFILYLAIIKKKKIIINRNFKIIINVDKSG